MTINKRLCLAISFALLTFTSLPAAAMTEQQTKMIEQLDQLDHLEFAAQIDKASACITTRDFTCAEKKLIKAAKYAINPHDKKALKATRQDLVSERRLLAEEERQRIEEETRQAEEKRRQIEEDRRFAEEERQMVAKQKEADRLALQLERQQAAEDERRAQVAEDRAQTKENIMGLISIVGSATQNYYQVKIDTANQIRAAAMAAKEQRERAAEKAKAEREQEKETRDANQHAQKAERDRRQVLAKTAREQQQAQAVIDRNRQLEQSRLQKLARLQDQEQTLKREQELRDRAERKRAAAAEEAKQRVEKERQAQAEQQARSQYLLKVTAGTRLVATKCPDGKGIYYATGTRPKIKPEVVGCVDVRYRAYCPGSVQYSEGIAHNFIGMNGCFGDTYDINPKPPCKVDQVRIEVVETQGCSH